MLVYFAHPIDQARRGSLLFDDIGHALHSAGVSTFRPGGAFTVADDPLSDLASVQWINQAALDRADALVAWLPSGVATLGVPAEIETALRLGKPTLVLTDGNLLYKSVQIAAWRDAGASVRLWDDQQARNWETHPVDLIDLLRTPPMADPIRESVDVTGLHGPRQSVAGRAIEPGSERRDLLWTGEPNLIPGKYEGDAGLDLAIAEEVRLRATDYKLIPTGVHVAIPDGFFGLITGRSSTWAKHKCRVTQAVIDSGYRGELMVGILNEGQTVIFEKGTRLAQMILLPTFAGRAIQATALPESHRGLAGYGSSGQ